MHSDLDRLRTRAGVVRALRRYFDERGFVEVDTPVALSHLCPEPHIEAPRVELDVTFGGGHTRATRFLQTSPEVSMKRLLGAGAERIYQIAPCFRQGDHSPLHRPEFRLLEWYRRGETWTALLNDCEALLRAAATAVWGEPRTAKGHSLAEPFARVSMNDAFLRYAGFAVLDCLERPALVAQAERLGVHVTANDAWDDVFHKIFLEHVEPKVAEAHGPVFLTHYPTPLAALARRSGDDPRASERFELYVDGLELANGFGELVDPAEQRQRFARDRAVRADAGQASYDVDEGFYSALAAIPGAAGIALGLERLLLVAMGGSSLDDVACVPWGDT